MTCRSSDVPRVLGAQNDAAVSTCLLFSASGDLRGAAPKESTVHCRCFIIFEFVIVKPYHEPLMALYSCVRRFFYFFLSILVALEVRNQASGLEKSSISAGILRYRVRISHGHLSLFRFTFVFHFKNCLSHTGGMTRILIKKRNRLRLQYNVVGVPQRWPYHKDAHIIIHLRLGKPVRSFRGG